MYGVEKDTNEQSKQFSATVFDSRDLRKELDEPVLKGRAGIRGEECGLAFLGKNFRSFM